MERIGTEEDIKNYEVYLESEVKLENHFLREINSYLY